MKVYQTHKKYVYDDEFFDKLIIMIKQMGALTDNEFFFPYFLYRDENGEFELKEIKDARGMLKEYIADEVGATIGVFPKRGEFTEEEQKARDSFYEFFKNIKK